MTRKSQPTRADGDIAVGKYIEKTIDLVSRADPLERVSIMSALPILHLWEEFCRETESDLEGLYKSEIEELFNRYPPWCEHVRWVQDHWCRDEPERLRRALWHVSMLSHVVVGGHSVSRLPPCSVCSLTYLPDDFSDLHNRLFLWAESTGGVIFARPNDETAPLQRFSESILHEARFTAPMVNKDMFEVLQPERGDSSSLFLYDVYVVAASAADRFDCQTGKIRPIVPAAGLDGEGITLTDVSHKQDRRKKGAPKVAEMKRKIVKKFPNGEYLEPGRGAKSLDFEDSQVFQKALRELRNEAETSEGDIK